MGIHDSELSIVMEDRQTLDSTMDGQPYKAGHHAATLRRLLWREHLGLLPAQNLDPKDDPNAQPPDVCPNDVMEGPEYEFVADPMSDQVWEMWTGNATRNTDLFRHLFRADPDDNSKGHRFLMRFRTYRLTETMQSKLLTTMRLSCRDTTSTSRATSTIVSCQRKRSGRNWIR